MTSLWGPDVARPELTDADIAAVREVIAGSTLQSIEYYEVAARRHDAPPADESTENDGRLGIEVQLRIDATSFGVRLNANVVMPLGEATASVAGEYSISADFHPTERVLRMFANEVAVMTVLPYLREAIATSTSRVFGGPVHLPLIERGEIALDIEPEESAIAPA